LVNEKRGGRKRGGKSEVTKGRDVDRKKKGRKSLIKTHQWGAKSGKENIEKTVPAAERAKMIKRKKGDGGKTPVKVSEKFPERDKVARVCRVGGENQGVNNWSLGGGGATTKKGEVVWLQHKEQTCGGNGRGGFKNPKKMNDIGKRKRKKHFKKTSGEGTIRSGKKAQGGKAKKNGNREKKSDRKKKRQKKSVGMGGTERQ